MWGTSIQICELVLISPFLCLEVLRPLQTQFCCINQLPFFSSVCRDGSCMSSHKQAYALCMCKSEVQGFRRVLHHTSVFIPAVNFGQNKSCKTTGLLHHLPFFFSVKRERQKLALHTSPPLASADSVFSSSIFQ